MRWKPSTRQGTIRRTAKSSSRSRVRRGGRRGRPRRTPRRSRGQRTRAARARPPAPQPPVRSPRPSGTPSCRPRLPPSVGRFPSVFGITDGPVLAVRLPDMPPLRGSRRLSGRVLSGRGLRSWLYVGWSLTRIDPEDEKVYVNRTKDQIKGLPRVRPGSVPGGHLLEPARQLLRPWRARLAQLALEPSGTRRSRVGHLLIGDARSADGMHRREMPVGAEAGSRSGRREAPDVVCGGAEGARCGRAISVTCWRGFQRC